MRQAAIFFPFESKPSARSLPIPPPLPSTHRAACSRVSSLTATASRCCRINFIPDRKSIFEMNVERSILKRVASKFIETVHRGRLLENAWGGGKERIIFRRAPLYCRSLLRASNYTIKIFFYRLNFVNRRCCCCWISVFFVLMVLKNRGTIHLARRIRFWLHTRCNLSWNSRDQVISILVKIFQD